MYRKIILSAILIMLFLLLIFVFSTGENYITFNDKDVELTDAKGCDIFSKEDVVGTFVLYAEAINKIFVCNKNRAFEGKIPASTFKIVNALNALENKIVADENEIIAWDGVERDLSVWNQDTSLAIGMKNTTVWFYQEIARRTGEKKMQEFLSLLKYGNQDIGGGIDRFWLDGNLRISAFQQVEFLNKLYKRKLPLSKGIQDIVVKIIELDSGSNWKFYGKTGTGISANPNNPVSWLVGFTIYENKPYIYALNADLVGKKSSLRLDITKELLVNNGALPHM